MKDKDCFDCKYSSYEIYEGSGWDLFCENKDRKSLALFQDKDYSFKSTYKYCKYKEDKYGYKR